MKKASQEVMDRLARRKAVAQHRTFKVGDYVEVLPGAEDVDVGIAVGEQGIVIVAPTGHDPTFQLMFPARYDGWATELGWHVEAKFLKLLYRPRSKK